MLTENKCDCMPLNSIGCRYFFIVSPLRVLSCLLLLSRSPTACLLLFDSPRHTHNPCSATLRINSGGDDGNSSFVKQVSMESWIMCLLCKMENFFDVVAIIACVSLTLMYALAHSTRFPIRLVLFRVDFMLFVWFFLPHVPACSPIILFNSVSFVTKIQQRQRPRRQLKWIGWWPIENCSARPCTM